MNMVRLDSYGEAAIDAVMALGEAITGKKSDGSIYYKYNDIKLNCMSRYEYPDRGDRSSSMSKLIVSSRILRGRHLDHFRRAVSIKNGAFDLDAVRRKWDEAVEWRKEQVGHEKRAEIEREERRQKSASVRKAFEKVGFEVNNAGADEVSITLKTDARSAPDLAARLRVAVDLASMEE